MNPQPCTLGYAFDDMHYSDATLHVPFGSMSAYQSAYGWKNFLNVVEFDATAIKDIHVGEKLNGTKVRAIYTLDGKKVSSTKPNQMYILEYSNGRKVKAIANK